MTRLQNSNILDWDQWGPEIGGLQPQTWLCVGEGFSREEIKEEFLRRGISLGPHSVTTPTELAQWALGKKVRLLGPLPRQRVLKQLLRQSAIRQRLVQLNRLQRRSGFFSTLDRSIQSGLLCHAHETQDQVLEERLEQFGLSRSLRLEVRLLAKAYQGFLENMELWDEPLLFEKATESLKGDASLLVWPQKIIWLQGKTRGFESRLAAFVDEVSRKVRLEKRTPTLDKDPETRWSSKTIKHERWHTLEDVIESVADQILKDPDQCAVLIPDDPSVRRSLKFALAQKGLVPLDPRDPLSWKSDEILKEILLPVRVLASGFGRAEVLSWIRVFCSREDGSVWIRELEESGWDGGMPPKSLAVEAHLQALSAAFPQRCQIDELEMAWMSWWKSQSREMEKGCGLIRELLGRIRSELEWVSESRGLRKRMPLRSWWRDLSERIGDESPPIDSLKPRRGVAIYRFQQWPIRKYHHVFAIELDWNWTRAEGGGDYWFSQRERQVLSAEFELTSRVDQSLDRQEVIRSWCEAADEFAIIQADYDVFGHAREIHPEGWSLVFPGAKIESTDRGASSKWRRFYEEKLSVPPQRVELPQVSARAGGRMTASELERLSRCAFQALFYHRWKLEDLREASAQMWPDVKGLLLHRLAEELVLKPHDNLDEVIERVWSETQFKGYHQKAPVVRFEKRRLKEIAEVFLAKDQDYRACSGAEPWLIESKEALKRDFDGVEIRGRADRIDRHPEGLFLMDYKSGSNLPHGFDMAEKSYRLQLPFYALAARDQYQKEVLGVQFVSLDRTGGRTRGVFFKKWNGKKEGCLTQLRKDSKNLFDVESPSDLWSVFEKAITAQVKDWKSGRFNPAPKIETECQNCAGADLCGRTRLERATG